MMVLDDTLKDYQSYECMYHIKSNHSLDSSHKKMCANLKVAQEKMSYLIFCVNSSGNSCGKNQIQNKNVNLMLAQEENSEDDPKFIGLILWKP